MRWYDYVFCIFAADCMVNPIFGMLESESIWMVMFNAMAAYGWWIIFEWYAEARLKGKI